MLGLSAAARRWGSLAGGILAGLPLTSAPILAYIALDQGQDFARLTALGALDGLAAVACAYLAYAGVMTTRSVAFSCLVALAAFLLVSAVLTALGGGIQSVAVFGAACLVVLRMTRTSGGAPPRPHGALSLPVRVAVPTFLVVLVTGLAPHLGPDISGILAPIPVLAWPLTVFAHMQGGAPQAALLIRGNVISGFGVLLFYIVLYYGLRTEHALATFGLAIAVSVVVAAGLARLLPVRPPKAG